MRCPGCIHTAAQKRNFGSYEVQCSQAEAEAILLGDHFPPQFTKAPPSGTLPGCSLRRSASGGPISEGTLHSLRVAREAWEEAMAAAVDAQADPMLSTHAQEVLDMLQALKQTLDAAGNNLDSAPLGIDNAVCGWGRNYDLAQAVDH